MDADADQIEITPAESGADIAASFPVMRELRPQLVDIDAYCGQVRRQMEDGYRLALLRVNGEIAGCGGFRVHEALSRGRYMYVEDLVTSPQLRSYGLGDKLFGWLIDQARAAGCLQLEIISGVQRTDAHRFYHRKRMGIKAFQLVLALS